MKAISLPQEVNRSQSKPEAAFSLPDQPIASRGRIWLLSLALLSASPLIAQVPDSQPSGAPAAQPASASSNKDSGKKKEADPGFDPASETVSWQGKSWNVNNNRIFEARFEKYLNAPEETTADDRNYQLVISQILADLAPGRSTKQSIDHAFSLLPRGSSFDIDARLCDALADAVYSSWKSLRFQDHLEAAGAAMEAKRSQEYWRARHISAGEAQNNPKVTTSGSGKTAKSQTTKQSFEDTAAQAQVTGALAEIELKLKANVVKQELSSIQAKVEFQALAVQFFLQRRFQHVLMATRFYRAIFTDGDTKLNVGKDTKDLFEKSAGMPPTVGTLDSMANEAIRDVREGVQSYNFLVQKNEMESATKRLGESFTVGEYLPEIRTLPREKKRLALDFAKKSYQLISALDVKDYTLAEQLVKDLGTIAKDFDPSKPMAAIETSKTVANFHLLKARNAASSGDRQTLETELTAATEIWPRNPKLAEVATMISNTTDTVQLALNDFDQLLSQKNYRQIFEKRATFIAATTTDPTRQAKLKEVLEHMEVIELTIIQSNAMAQQSNYAGAWECVEKIASDFPDDNKLSMTRANLTTQAADFVRTLRSAQDLEKKDLLGSSLAQFLKARKLYPASGFANDGVTRLVKKILPEA